jgi:hypothetical protein
MCYEPYYRSSPTLTTEQRSQGIAAAAQHHRLLQSNVVTGVPGAEHAYREHIEMHKRQAAAYNMGQEQEAEQNTLSILTGELAIAQRARRKYDRALTFLPDDERRAAARQRRIERRLARRSGQTTASVERFLAECRGCGAAVR